MTLADQKSPVGLRDETDCELSILLVGYNSAGYLAACLDSIDPAISGDDYEVLFVNNGTDNSEELVRRQYPQVRVCESRGNIGFAAANNYLAEQARGRWLLLLNPDTRLFPDALDHLLDVARRNPHYDVLGGVTVGESGEPQVQPQHQLPSLATLLRIFVLGGSREAYPNPHKEVVDVEALHGGFMMVRRDCWFELGGLDKGFFLYAEELDFFKRLRDRGGRVAQVSGSRMFHDFGSGNVYSPNRIRFLTTGNAHYFHKNHSSAYAYAAVFLLWATAMRRYLGGGLLARRSDRHARMAQGFSRVATAPWTWIWGYNSAGADPRKRAIGTGATTHCTNAVKSG